MGKAEKTRQYIVEKTAPLFNKQGYAGTSLNDIMEATGLSKGSVYGNFANKEEVALAVFDHNMGQIKHIIAREMDRRETAKEKLMAYVDVYTHFSRYPFPAGGCPMLNTAVEADDTHPPLKKRALDAINDWKEVIITLLQTGIKEGEFRTDIHPEQVALSLIAILEGSIMLANLSDKSRYRKMIMGTVKNMIGDLS